MLWLARWLAFRPLAVLLGAALYVYMAVQHPEQMRVVQVQAASLVDMVAKSMPPKYAVWVPALNLTSSLAMIAFVLVAMLVIDVSARLLRLCGRGIWYLVHRK